MSWRHRILFLSGQIGVMALTRYLFQWIVIYTSEKDSLTSSPLFPVVAVGVVLLVFRIFDAVIDPVCGTLSDRWVKSGRERRTLLWFAFTVPSLGLILCFSPTAEMPEILRWGLLVSGLFIFFVGYTLYAIPYWSLTDDFSGEDLEQRRSLSNLLGVGLIIATALGFVASPWIVGRFGYFIGATVFGLVAIVLMILPYFAAPPSGAKAKESVPAKFTPRQALIQTFKHKRFVALLVIFSGSQMSLTIMTASAPFIAVRLLGGTNSDVALIMGPLLGVAIPSFLLVPWISRTIGWERGLLYASVGLAIVYTLSAFLGQPVIGSASTTAMMIFGLGGPMIAVLLGLEAEAIAACAREEQGDNVSLYFGVFNMVIKALNGVSLLVATQLVKLSEGQMGELAIRALPLSAGSFLLIGVALNIVLRRKYPAPKNA